MKLKLHIAETEDFSQEVLTDMGNVFDLSTGSVDNIKSTLNEVDIFWFRLGYQIDKNVLDENSRCKILATPVTGIDHIDEKLCHKLGIKIICLRGEKEFLREVRATAEHSILLAMMLMRKAAAAVFHTQNTNWKRDLFRGHEIYKKNIGILGLGRLGKIVAEYYQVFGCQIFFYDTSKVEYPETWNMCNSAEEVIDNADIVSIHIPYNEHTDRIYGNKFFQHFTNQKWLVNTARGGVIDEQYMLRALKENRIAGAALDVLQGEPNNINEELINFSRENDNLILTPHIGGNTYESFEKTEKFIAQKIKEAIA